jgi:hypothetical protein
VVHDPVTDRLGDPADQCVGGPKASLVGTLEHRDLARQRGVAGSSSITTATLSRRSRHGAGSPSGAAATSASNGSPGIVAQGIVPQGMAVRGDAFGGRVGIGPHAAISGTRG